MNPQRRRRHNLSRIRQFHCYTTHEIAELFGVHKNTVRQWLKQGLPKIDGTKPFLIHGTELRAFLKQKQESRQAKCRPDELYCLRCRKPQPAWEGLADVILRNTKTMHIIGICAVCEAKTSKLASVKNIPEVFQTYRVQTLHGRHIAESLPPSLRCYLEKEKPA